MMTLAHALIVAEARSCLAALAETPSTFEQLVAYDRLLLRLDWLHGDDTPACEPMPELGRAELLRRAELTIERLVDFGVDGLSVELLLAGLEDASALG